MSLLGKQDLNILVDEVKQDINRKVNAIKGDLFAPSENTKLTTTNGIKEFTCEESGYVDNVYLEGETLVNIAPMSKKDKSNPDGVVRTRFNPSNDESFKGNQRVSNGTFTLYNFTDKNIRYVGKTSANVWGVTFIVPSNSHMVVNISATDSLCGVDFEPKDGWSNADLDVYKPSMYMILEGTHEFMPYFEGMKSVGQGDEIEVLTCTQRPINIGDIVVGAIDTTTGAESPDSKYRRNDRFIGCSVEEYTINLCDNSGQIVVLFYDENKNFISFTHRENTRFVTFTPPSNACYLRFRFKMFGSEINAFLYKGNTNTILYDKQQINTTLRSTSPSVKDIIFKQNGKYYKLKKCVETILNPDKVMNEQWFIENSDGFIGFKIDISGTGVKFNSSCVSPRFRNLGEQTQEAIHVSDATNHCFAVSVYATKLPSKDVVGFKKYLTDNQIPIVCELEVPIIEELSNFNPRTFKGDNVIIVNTGALRNETSFDITTALRNEMEVVKDKLQTGQVIHYSTSLPNNNQGKDGDVWIVYEG